MIPLPNKDYYKALKPLEDVTFNKLFALYVVEGRIPGTIYVDNEKQPTTFYILHKYGMSLLLGATNNEKFNVAFKEYALNTARIRNNYEWLQVYPSQWNSVLNDLFKDEIIRSTDNQDNSKANIIELNSRINFKFNVNKYMEFRKKNPNENQRIVRTNKKIFNEMKGSVVPSNFWNTADEFNKKGIGFSLFSDNKLVTTAYSAFINEKELELGMETVPEYRGMGFAKHACSALIDYCLEKNLEPIWACRLENTGSYNLAIRLGFEPTESFPYYRLSN
ncbi:GNAT family N-acetyltransferase [Gillisia sp. M10.2A]|uniref:GNAT family N-acetyltransferase n=1 Tax=Gillisia lutea TaxID=2909668 RepID=A0ABS9EK91_9FLAO|nr:GNAT family N-acetyltransferase [Gillisia lutea]MCF4101913.1 GNAT family N-acetyltransferase [Gillisia lutea]